MPAIFYFGFFGIPEKSHRKATSALITWISKKIYQIKIFTSDLSLILFIPKNEIKYRF